MKNFGLVSATGKVFEIIKAIAHAVYELGGDDDDLLKIISGKHEDLPRALASTIMSTHSEISETLKKSWKWGEKKRTILIVSGTEVEIKTVDPEWDSERILNWFYSDDVPPRAQVIDVGLSDKEEQARQRFRAKAFATSGGGFSISDEMDFHRFLVKIFEAGRNC